MKCVEIQRKPMIQWVYERTNMVSCLDEVYVATDDERIKQCVELFGGKCIMTATNHESGTDRLAECVELLKLDDTDIVLNIQGDEPLIEEQMILEPNLDRISMMLSFFFLMYAKEIQRLSKKEYHKLSDRIITLDKMKDYANRLVDKKCNIGEIPYLDEIICLDDDKVYDRDKQLSLFRRIFR